MARDDWKSIDWSWLSMNGYMTKALLEGKKSVNSPTDPGKKASTAVCWSRLTAYCGPDVEGANRTDMEMVETIPG